MGSIKKVAPISSAQLNRQFRRCFLNMLSLEERCKIAAWMEVFQSVIEVQRRFRASMNRIMHQTGIPSSAPTENSWRPDLYRTDSVQEDLDRVKKMLPLSGKVSISVEERSPSGELQLNWISTPLLSNESCVSVLECSLRRCRWCTNWSKITTVEWKLVKHCWSLSYIQ